MKWKYQPSTSLQKVKPSFLPEKPQGTSFAKTLIKRSWTKIFGLFYLLQTHPRLNKLSNINLWLPNRSSLKLGNSLQKGVVWALDKWLDRSFLHSAQAGKPSLFGILLTPSKTIAYNWKKVKSGNFSNTLTRLIRARSTLLIYLMKCGGRK